MVVYKKGSASAGTGPQPRTPQQDIEAWFAAKLEDPEARIVELRRHAEGWSWQTYTLAVETGGSRPSLVPSQE